LESGLSLRIVEERVLHLFLHFLCVVVQGQMELSILKVQPDLSVGRFLGILRVKRVVDKSQHLRASTNNQGSHVVSSKARGATAHLIVDELLCLSLGCSDRFEIIF